MNAHITFGGVKMDQNEFNKIAAGMDRVNDEMCRRIYEKAPMCHFRKMHLEQSDSVDGYYTEWWECSVCGHTKNIR